MTVASLLFGAGAASRPAERTAPPPRTSTGGPVFIHDCIMPTADATLLLALWRRWDEARAARRDDPPPAP